MDVERSLFPILEGEVGKPFVSVLMGTRQVGKSWLMRKLYRAFGDKGISSAYFDLEDPYTLKAFNADDAAIVDLLRGAGKVVFIDEFQYAKNATRIFKAIHDGRTGPKLYVSGSSSVEMHRHLKESLAGRFRITMITPLDWIKEYSTLPGAEFVEYLRFGGLPGLVNESHDNEKMSMLRDILQAYILKDIRGLLKEENIRAFNSLIYLLAERQGSVVTVASLAREVRLSEPTVRSHLDILDQTYVAFSLDSYSTSLGNELKKSKKYYLYDLGIRNAILRDFSRVDERPDKGVIAETFVFLALRRQLAANMELRFWRNKQGDEVDFILVRDRVPIPIEVKYHLDGPEIPSGIKAFFRAYPEVPEAWVYSVNLNADTGWEGRRVHFRTLAEAEAFTENI
jgi:predicted AAA+ superfamily ATPase